MRWKIICVSQNLILQHIVITTCIEIGSDYRIRLKISKGIYTPGASRSQRIIIGDCQISLEVIPLVLWQTTLSVSRRLTERNLPILMRCIGIHVEVCMFFQQISLMRVGLLRKLIGKSVTCTRGLWWWLKGRESMWSQSLHKSERKA